MYETDRSSEGGEVLSGLADDVIGGPVVTLK
jgi:hypothetical protein